MQIYSVGPDELNEYDFGYLNKDAFEWFVYYYEWYDGYSAGGHGVAFRKEDGKLVHGDLGHCSCYGPIENDWVGAEAYTVEEYLAMESGDSIFDYIVRPEMKDKVKELLG